MDNTAALVARRRVWPGSPYPLGATWDGKGVNFALFSAHAEAVELCIFDTAGVQEVWRVRMTEYTDEVWHLYLPDARPGLLYGYRVFGPYEPENGHRFNHHKLLLDPYALSFHGELRWTDAHFGYRVGSMREDLSFDRRDNARLMPKCRVVETAFTWGDDRHPRTRWEESVILEAHVRGMTQTHPNVDRDKRGTFAGLASPPIIDYLVDLGITAIELLPIHAFLNDRHLVQRGLTNYWGYNTFGFFAPDPRFLAGSHIDEFKTMVRRFHDVGIEVILDVVYNHTCEGNQMGPTLSFRGIDNKSYYCLDDNPRYYFDVTGTGNTVNLSHPRVMQMVMDSLRYWVNEMRVDGFRFDLCPTLGRENRNFDQGSAFFDAVRQDPVLNSVKMIAEPWDIGPDGYQLGGFPPGWAEWNASFRDTTRRFWRGDTGLLPDMASRVAGSSDIFDHNGRRPWASINLITAHDGFTLHDLVSYNDKHNEANGEENRDGHDANFSWNCEAEGESEDADVIALRARQKRNLLATLLLSLGVPMLVAGDEQGRSQRGNNNAYCQDNELSWVDWNNLRPEDEELREFTRRLIRIRRDHRVFSRPRFFLGEVVSSDGLKDITWITPDGREHGDDEWQNSFALCFGYVLNGAAGEFYTKGGQRDLDDSFLVMMNAYYEDIPFRLPALTAAFNWEPLIDTANADGLPRGEGYYGSGDAFILKCRSLVLFVNRGALAKAEAVVNTLKVLTNDVVVGEQTDIELPDPEAIPAA